MLKLVLVMADHKGPLLSDGAGVHGDGGAEADAAGPGELGAPRALRPVVSAGRGARPCFGVRRW